VAKFTDGYWKKRSPFGEEEQNTRTLLRQFGAQLPDLRRHLATYHGWFEVFSVPKRRYKPELIAYAKALKKAQKLAQPIPESIEQALHPEVARLVQLGIHPKDMPKNLRDDLYDLIQL
jgi:hypothetical protein